MVVCSDVCLRAVAIVLLLRVGGMGRHCFQLQRYYMVQMRLTFFMCRTDIVLLKLIRGLAIRYVVQFAIPAIVSSGFEHNPQELQFAIGPVGNPLVSLLAARPTTSAAEYAKLEEPRDDDDGST